MTAHAWILLITLSLIWGGSFFFNEILLMELSVFGVVFGRVLVGFLMLFVIVSAQGHKLNLRQNWKPFLTMGILNNLIPFNLIVFGQTFIDSGLASIFNATTPFFAVLLAYVSGLKDEVSMAKLFGVLVGLAGVCVLFEVGSGDLDRNTAIGGGYVICAAISYAFAGIYGRRFKSIVPQVSACGMLLFAAILTLPMAVYSDGTAVTSLSWTTIGAVFGIGILSTGFAYILYFRILNIAGAVNLLLVTLLIPISATTLGVFALGEQVTASEIAGMSIITVGLLIVDGRVPARLARRIGLG